jgi:hypothetical protein
VGSSGVFTGKRGLEILQKIRIRRPDRGFTAVQGIGMGLGLKPGVAMALMQPAGASSLPAVFAELQAFAKA